MAYSYAVVSMLEAFSTDFAFENWPLHSTLVTNFLLEDEGLNGLIAELDTYFAGAHQVSAEAVEKDLFGPNRDVSVTRFAERADLMQIHDDLVDLIERHQVVFLFPTHMRTGHHPHATDRPTARVEPGTTVLLTNAALVCNTPAGDGSQRHVIKVWPLAPVD